MKIDQSQDGFDALKKQFDADFEAGCEFQRTAANDYAFYEGNQWTEEEKGELSDGNKPSLVLNLVMSNINSVLGAEISNKRRIIYQPRSTDKNINGEMMTAAGEWFQDEADADSVNSDSFSDAMICGLGCVEVSLDFDNSPLGRPFMSAIDIKSMVIDRDAHKCNLQDARRAFRLHRMAKSDAKALFPGADEGDLDFCWGDSEGDRKTYKESALIRGDLPSYADFFGKEAQDNIDYCTICEARWIEQGEPYYLTNDWRVIEPAIYESLPPGGRPKAIRFFSKITRRGWVGEK
ncbi:hypothetical protein DPQ22_04550, partial [Candidatus Tokpelaia sp.]